MFSHIFVGSDDVDASKKFYDSVLGELGIAPGRRDDHGRVFYRSPTGLFAITRPIDGQPASAANGGTIGFAADTTAAIDRWHAAGVANGGTSCEDPPGIRQGSAGPLYLAYLRDPAGNKICALMRMTG
jgi:catechol 2,3-dioxygenase-like lactoylglutathione lyase family enzyme